MSSNSTSPLARPMSMPCGLSGTVDWESSTRKKSARTGIWKKTRLTKPEAWSMRLISMVAKPMKLTISPTVASPLV